MPPAPVASRSAHLFKWLGLLFKPAFTGRGDVTFGVTAVPSELSGRGNDDRPVHQYGATAGPAHARATVGGQCAVLQRHSAMLRDRLISVSTSCAIAGIGDVRHPTAARNFRPGEVVGTAEFVANGDVPSGGAREFVALSGDVAAHRSTGEPHAASGGVKWRWARWRPKASAGGWLCYALGQPVESAPRDDILLDGEHRSRPAPGLPEGRRRHLRCTPGSPKCWWHSLTWWRSVGRMVS